MGIRATVTTVKIVQSRSENATDWTTYAAGGNAHIAALFAGNVLGTFNAAPINAGYYDSYYTTSPWRGITVNGSIMP